MPAQQRVWLEQEQKVAQLLSQRSPCPLVLSYEGSKQKFLEARESRCALLSTADDGELLTQEQDFQVFLIKRLSNDVKDVEQKDNELVKRIPKHE